MAASGTTPFRVRRKPLPSQAYTQVPLHEPEAALSPAYSTNNIFGKPAREQNTRAYNANGADSHGVPLLPPFDFENATPQPRRINATETSVVSDRGHLKTLLVDQSLLKAAVDDSGHRQRAEWTPFWLHWAVLLAIGVLVLSLLAALVGLYIYSRMHNGISPQLSENHYYWTYGPTAVLMLVVALWRQVDYTSRRLTPWQRLCHHNPDARQSLLLDYLSPILFTSLWRALRYRHWCVVISLLGFMLLKILTVFSTGLIVLSSITVTEHDVQLQTSTGISSMPYCNTTYETCNSTLMTIQPLLDYYGLLDSRLAFPSGTTDHSLYETVDIPPTLNRNALITTTVSGFYPHWECQEATIFNSTGFPQTPREFEDDYGYAAPTIQALPFNITNGTQVWQVINLADMTFCNASMVACPKYAVDLWDLGMIWDSNQTASGTPWLLIVNHVAYNQTIEPTLNQSALPEYPEVEVLNITAWSAKLLKSVAITCLPHYSVEETRLTIDNSRVDASKVVNVQGPLTDTGRHLKNYTDQELVYDMQEMLTFVVSGAFPESSESGATMFDMMARLKAVESNEAYLDPEVLMNVSARAYRMLATQMAREVFQVKSARPLTASIMHPADRLHVKGLSFWILAVGFTIMPIFILAIHRTKPRTMLYQDPGTIASSACILRARSDLNEILCGLSASTDKLLLKTIDTNWAGTKAHLSPSLRSSVSTSDTRETARCDYHPAPENSNSSSFWQPMAATKWFCITSAAVLIAAIVILAVLQYISDRNNGIANVNVSAEMLHSLSTYIPAAIMLLVATSCTSISFAITTTIPYHHLKRGQALADRTVLLDLNKGLPLMVICRSLRKGMLAPALVSIAALLGSFLTIVVSGLYTSASILIPRPISLNKIDFFENTWTGTGNDNNAMGVLNLLEHANASFPTFTYDELAVPIIEVAQNDETLSSALKYNGGLSFSALLPVRRGSLNCTAIKQTDFGVTMQPYNDVGDCQSLHCGYGVGGNAPWSTFDVKTGPGEYCNFPGQPSKQSNVTFELELEYPMDNFEGGITHLEGCPSLGFTLGYFSTDRSRNYTEQDSTHKDNVTTIACSQFIEESTIPVHFHLPSMSIDQSNPPVFDGNNRKIVSTTQFKITDFLSSLSHYPQYGYGRADVYTGRGAPIDPFMQIILSGRNGIPAEELVHPEDADNFIDAIQHVYRLYMAQAISLNMRQNYTNGATNGDSRFAARAGPGPEVVQGTFIDPSRMRLVQNRTSAILLEVLLGVILLLGTVAYATVRMSKILPHNPCTIAGVMSFLASSHLCDPKIGMLPEGAEYWNEKERQLEFRKWRYSMGWWDDAGGDLRQSKGANERSRFAVDVHDAKRDDG